MDRAKKRQIALKYIAKNKLMTIATLDKNKPWAATVFYNYDSKFNIYFFSRTDTKHCENIKISPNVAIAINEHWNDSGLITGIQMQGKAFVVSKREYNKCYKSYNKRFPWADEFKKDHILYRIKPTSIHHINEKAFGHFFRVRVL